MYSLVFHIYFYVSYPNFTFGFTSYVHNVQTDVMDNDNNKPTASSDKEESVPPLMPPRPETKAECIKILRVFGPKMQNVP